MSPEDARDALRHALSNSYGLALRKAVRSPAQSDFEMVVRAILFLRDELGKPNSSSDTVLVLWALVATEATRPFGLDTGESAEVRALVRRWHFVFCQMVELMLIGEDLDDVLAPFVAEFGRRPAGF